MEQATKAMRPKAGTVRVLVGLQDYADAWVRQISVIWRDSGNKTAVLGLGEPKGGPGGGMNSDLATIPNPIGAYISNITVWDNATEKEGNWQLCGHQITYKRGRDTLVGRAHGTKPSRKIDIAFGPHDHVTAVEGHASDSGMVHRLQFITTNARSKYSLVLPPSPPSDHQTQVLVPSCSCKFQHHLKQESCITQVRPIFGVK
ncbi:hypothetical protein B0H66DRAFT_212106 [Apodospora peruviana]|uniref:Jacalin-type lectin domain-containing protein n=1 Tax=Apodospora peruviana TaxID=516989 RepID=A0AAE0IDD6_9PEZI|nr:hypothetical protein B0H66DRAFT_212106 [Apodospora peruviana]